MVHTSLLVGDYTLGIVIGRGSSAVVHQAWQRKTGAFVAIKKFERGNNDLKAVLTEIELLSKLDHPNIVKYLGAIDSVEGHLHVILEYMENGSLAHQRRRIHPRIFCAELNWLMLRHRSANSLVTSRSQSVDPTYVRLEALD